MEAFRSFTRRSKGQVFCVGSRSAAIELGVGRELHAALLRLGHQRDLDVVSGIEVGPCASLPCLAIGGDFFDYTSLPDGAFGFVLGDVSGKGLPAALLSAMVQGIFALETLLGESPASAVSRLNDMLLRKALAGRFATLFYAVLTRDGRLTYTNAGHNAPIAIGASGIRRLHRGGTIVGAFPEATYEQDTVTVAPGDLVVAFSDGVTEAFNAQWEEFGEERLIDYVQANQALSPPAIRDGLIAAIKSFVNDAVQSDDITILVLRYTRFD